jgi:hypothetical protein
VDENPRLSRADLRNTAVYQKGILVCILVYLVVYLVFAAVQYALPPKLRVILALVAIPISVTATVFVFLLATKVYSQGLGILFGILTLIPCVGLIVLLIINAKATAVLKDHGIRVGLLGANMSDIERL